jgi:hypothetical protein
VSITVFRGTPIVRVLATDGDSEFSESVEALSMERRAAAPVVLGPAARGEPFLIAWEVDETRMEVLALTCR